MERSSDLNGSQPHYPHVSIDERMVRNNDIYSFRQHIKDKPTKWGMKWWVLADSCNGYTYDNWLIFKKKQYYF